MVAFNRMAEYPLESVTSIVINPAEQEGGVEVFYSTPGGMGLANISAETISTLESDPNANAAEAQTGKANGQGSGGKTMTKTDSSDSKKTKVTPQTKAAAKLLSPPAPKADLAEETKDITPEKKSAQSPSAHTSSDEDLQKLLKKVCPPS